MTTANQKQVKVLLEQVSKKLNKKISKNKEKQKCTCATWGYCMACRIEPKCREIEFINEEIKKEIEKM
jgi:hypothetical protein